MNRIRKTEPILEFVGDYRFLSNFWPCIITYQGIIFPSVEHVFQACKTRSRNGRIRFSKLTSAVEAKREGRKVLLRRDWEKVKEMLMFRFLKKKFVIEELTNKLISTGDAKLVEGNWWNDTYWGVCRGVGKNRLGKLLMKVRKEVGGV